MGKVWSYILRFGPLVAAIALGVAAAVPNFAAVINQILAVVGFIGVVPDPELGKQLVELVLGVLALTGGARKVWALVKAYFTPIA